VPSAERELGRQSNRLDERVEPLEKKRTNGRSFGNFGPSLKPRFEVFKEAGNYHQLDTENGDLVERAVR